MASEKKLVQIRSGDGAIRECAIEIDAAPRACLTFLDSGEVKKAYVGEDFFEALIALRLKLEEAGMQLLCCGARRDVFPSGMSRSMSLGRMAYITRLGVPSLPSDLVDIFDYAEPEVLGSVAQQAEFHEAWVNSLRSQ